MPTRLQAERSLSACHMHLHPDKSANGSILTGLLQSRKLQHTEADGFTQIKGLCISRGHVLFNDHPTDMQNPYPASFSVFQHLRRQGCFQGSSCWKNQCTFNLLAFLESRLPLWPHKAPSWSCCMPCHSIVCQQSLQRSSLPPSSGSQHPASHIWRLSRPLCKRQHSLTLLSPNNAICKAC